MVRYLIENVLVVDFVPYMCVAFFIIVFGYFLLFAYTAMPNNNSIQFNSIVRECRIIGGVCSFGRMRYKYFTGQ